MSEPRTYLDHNASSPADPRVVAAVAGHLSSSAGNPSSLHAEGRLAREAVELARRRVGAMLHGTAERVIFTSGGTEANGIAIAGLARLAAKGGPARLLTTHLEHPSCVGPAEQLGHGWLARELAIEIRFARPSADGRLRVSDLEPLFEGPGLVVAQLANHELGTLHDVAAIADRAAAAGMWLHCDAVQAAGKIALNVAELGAATVTVSAHKMGGPQGVGALWVREDLELAPLFAAGHQERGFRPGTENVAGIVGFGVAAELVPERLAAMESVRELTAQLEARLLEVEGARVHGAQAARVGNTVNVAFDGVPGDLLVQALDIAGVAASTGAACTSGSTEPSPVLLALGLSAEEAAQSVRFSLGPSNSQIDVDKAVAAIALAVPRARQFS